MFLRSNGRGGKYRQRRKYRVILKVTYVLKRIGVRTCDGRLLISVYTYNYDNYIHKFLFLGSFLKEDVQFSTFCQNCIRI